MSRILRHADGSLAWPPGTTFDRGDDGRSRADHPCLGSDGPLVIPNEGAAPAVSLLLWGRWLDLLAIVGFDGLGLIAHRDRTERPPDPTSP